MYVWFPTKWRDNRVAAVQSPGQMGTGVGLGLSFQRGGIPVEKPEGLTLMNLELDVFPPSLSVNKITAPRRLTQSLHRAGKYILC